MKERVKQLGSQNVYVRIWTLKDKERPMFRAKEPDTHIVEIVLYKEGRSHCMIRDWHFDTVKQAKAQFDYISTLLK